MGEWEDRSRKNLGSGRRSTLAGDAPKLNRANYWMDQTLTSNGGLTLCDDWMDQTLTSNGGPDPM